MNPPTEQAPQLNHVFVDFENVHAIDFSSLQNKTVQFYILAGAHDTKLRTDLVQQLMKNASSVEFIRLTSSGKNALDYAVAYYVGRSAVAYPKAHIHVISKDKGFDPLLEHLKTRRIRAERHVSFDALKLFLSPKNPFAGNEDLLSKTVAVLKKNASARPKKKKTLLSLIKSTLGNSGTVAQAEAVLSQLSQTKHISLDVKDKVTYKI